MNIRGRHEGSTCQKVRIENGTLEADDGPEPGSRVLRIEDKDNPAFWIDVLLTEVDLIRLLTGKGRMTWDSTQTNTKEPEHGMPI
jgi:hypothetical protein